MKGPTNDEYSLDADAIRTKALLDAAEWLRMRAGMSGDGGSAVSEPEWPICPNCGYEMSCDTKDEGKTFGPWYCGHCRLQQFADETYRKMRIEAGYRDCFKEELDVTRAKLQNALDLLTDVVRDLEMPEQTKDSNGRVTGILPPWKDDLLRRAKVIIETQS